MRRLPAALGLAGTSLISIATLDAMDRRRIKADPAWETLRQDPPGARNHAVTSSDGTTLHVQEWGPEDAPPVVLVHGWTCAIRFWRLQIADLMADHRVIAYDLRGHGLSGGPESGDWSLDRFGDDLEAVLEARVPDGGAVIAGHSLGAMTIASWGGLHRDWVTRFASAVALINTGLGDLISESLIVKTPGALRSVEAAIGGFVLGASAPLPKRPDPASHRITRYVALSPSAGPAAVRFTEGLVLDCPPRVRASCGRELSGMDLLDRVEHLKVPALVIAGEVDKLTPPSHAHRMADALPDCIGLDILGGSGHMSPLERPADINRRLRELVKAPQAAPA